MRPNDRIVLYWIGVTLLLFPILVLLGILLRTTQAGALASHQAWFYPLMTLHGLGMVGLWFVAAMAGVSHVLSRHVEPSRGVAWIALVGTVAGVGLLIASVLAGRFAAGWYFLYPLPLRGLWPTWATVLFLAALAVLGVSWLVWSLDLLRAIARRYTLSQALGWHYLTGRPGPEVPPAVLITTVSLIACLACLVSAVLVLVFFTREMAGGGATDALLMKNLTFFFGHVLVNLSLYLGVAIVYEILPEYAGRAWKTNRVVAISWNAVLAIVLFAYFHHLYMDFAQPVAAQFLGQVASYLSAIPAAVVTIFGALLLVHRANMRWNTTTSLFVVGLAGWAIGGIGAVIDSTIAVNAKLHNTLWVPGHFHTYMILGLVMFVLGYYHHVCQERSSLAESPGLHRWLARLFVLGGGTLVASFYWAGALSVPRRFAVYPDVVQHGQLPAAVGAVGASLFLVGFLVYVVSVGRRWMRALRAAA
ncbi:MAG: cytochrome c oxidase subunit [Acidobacteriota bacterium]|nr:cytochrome c oxidase subunit [Acidobacteriota bacterium]